LYTTVILVKTNKGYITISSLEPEFEYAVDALNVLNDVVCRVDEEHRRYAVPAV